MFACGIRNPGLWNTEFSLRRESGIPLTIGIYKKFKIHYWEVGNHTFSLRSKRFRLVSKQRKTEERDFGILAPFFAWSLTLVPRSLLLNRTETLATQASTPRNPESKTVLDYSVRYMGETSHHDTCIVYTKDLYKKSRKNST